MIAYLNGRFVEEAEAVVPIADRGFLYGDSLFETLRVANGRPFRWPLHVERLRKGAKFLGIAVTPTPKELRAVMAELIRHNERSDCLLRVTLSRGVGPRGYSPRSAGPPTLVMTVHELPTPSPGAEEGWRVGASSFRLAANDRLTTHKTGSRLLNVLARAEAEASDYQEALLLNTNGEVVEATGANVFWIKRETVTTSPSALGALPGITRAVVLELCTAEGVPTQKRIATLEVLQSADAVFLTNSGEGVVNVCSIDGTRLRGSALVAKLREAYEQLVRRETA